MSTVPPLDLSVYLVADAGVCEAVSADLPDVAARAVAGGATAVQLRAKDLGGGAFTELAAAVSRALPSSVPLLINDRVDVALTLRARGLACAGVHLGQSDLPVDDARALLGADAIIGLSAALPEQIRAAADSPARVDYIGIGPLHSTATKPDAPAGIGMPTVLERARASALPAVAIGGVTAADMPALRAGGLVGGAVVSCICADDDPEAAARRLADAWKETP